MLFRQVVRSLPIYGVRQRTSTTYGSHGGTIHVRNSVGVAAGVPSPWAAVSSVVGGSGERKSRQDTACELPLALSSVALERYAVPPPPSSPLRALRRSAHTRPGAYTPSIPLSLRVRVLRREPRSGERGVQSSCRSLGNAACSGSKGRGRRLPGPPHQDCVDTSVRFLPLHPTWYSTPQQRRATEADRCMCSARGLAGRQDFDAVHGHRPSESHRSSRFSLPCRARPANYETGRSRSAGLPKCRIPRRRR